MSCHHVGAPGRNRTCNRRLRRPVLYPVELRTPGPELSHRRFETACSPSRTRIGVVGVEGFEPPTSCSQSRRATRLRYTPPTEPELLPSQSPAARQRDERAAYCPATGAQCQRTCRPWPIVTTDGRHRSPLQCAGAKVAELVDALVLGTSAARRAGSSPAFRTTAAPPAGGKPGPAALCSAQAAREPRSHGT